MPLPPSLLFCSHSPSPVAFFESTTFKSSTLSRRSAMAPSQLFRIVAFLSILPLLAQAYNLAPLAPQALQNRAAYQGGWALGLPGADCPAIAPVACSTRSETVNPTCCPEGQLCAGTIYPYCCPTGMSLSSR